MTVITKQTAKSEENLSIPESGLREYITDLARRYDVTCIKTPRDKYPWAGRDRLATAPGSLISKSGIQFSHPVDALRAVDEGLRLGQLKEKMTASPGLVMGMFAYGHPFLDGNGRTMLLVHLELSYRAGFSIALANTNKANYLTALSEEIKQPGKGILDTYLLKFKKNKLERGEWGNDILSMNGLDGLDNNNQVEGDFTDPGVIEKYKKFEKQRGYTYQVSETYPDTEVVRIHHKMN